MKIKLTKKQAEKLLKLLNIHSVTDQDLAELYEQIKAELNRPILLHRT